MPFSKDQLAMWQELRNREADDTKLINNLKQRFPDSRGYWDELRKREGNDTKILDTLLDMNKKWRVTDAMWGDLSPSSQQSYMQNYNVEIVPVGDRTQPQAIDKSMADNAEVQKLQKKYGQPEIKGTPAIAKPFINYMDKIQRPAQEFGYGVAKKLNAVERNVTGQTASPQLIKTLLDNNDKATLNSLAVAGKFPTEDMILKYWRKAGYDKDYKNEQIGRDMIAKLNSMSPKFFEQSASQFTRGEFRDGGKVTWDMTLGQLFSPTDWVLNIVGGKLVAQVGKGLLTKPLSVVGKTWANRTTGKALASEIFLGDIDMANIPQGMRAGEGRGVSGLKNIGDVIDTAQTPQEFRSLMAKRISAMPKTEQAQYRQAMGNTSNEGIQALLDMANEKRAWLESINASTEQLPTDIYGEGVTPIKTKYEAPEPKMQQQAITPEGKAITEQELMDQYATVAEREQMKRAMPTDTTDMYEQAYQRMNEGKSAIPEQPSLPIEQPIPEAQAVPTGVVAEQPIYAQAVELAKQQGSIGTAMLQRKLNIQYDESVNILSKMESEGIIKKKATGGYDYVGGQSVSQAMPEQPTESPSLPVEPTKAELPTKIAEAETIAPEGELGDDGVAFRTEPMTAEEEFENAVSGMLEFERIIEETNIGKSFTETTGIQHLKHQGWSDKEAKAIFKEMQARKSKISKTIAPEAIATPETPAGVVSEAAPKQAWEMTREEFIDNLVAQSDADPTLPIPNIEYKNKKWRSTIDKTISFSSKRDAIEYAYDNLDNPYLKHDYAIQQALSEGKPVHAEVLADYPDLAKAMPETPAGVVADTTPKQAWEMTSNEWNRMADDLYPETQTKAEILAELSRTRFIDKMENGKLNKQEKRFIDAKFGSIENLQERLAKAKTKQQKSALEKEIAESAWENYKESERLNSIDTAQAKYGNLVDSGAITIDNKSAIPITLKNHKDMIKQALSEGKPVPAEVLADYPDLAKAMPETPAGVVADTAPKQAWEMTREEYRKSIVSDDDLAYRPELERRAIAEDKTLSERQGFEYSSGEKQQILGAPNVARGLLDSLDAKVRVAEKRHRKAIETALSEGKPVPAEVLADYPDLAPAGAETPSVAGQAEPAGMQATPEKKIWQMSASEYQAMRKRNVEAMKPKKKAQGIEDMEGIADQSNYLRVKDAYANWKSDHQKEIAYALDYDEPVQPKIAGEYPSLLKAYGWKYDVGDYLEAKGFSRGDVPLKFNELSEKQLSELPIGKAILEHKKIVDKAIADGDPIKPNITEYYYPTHPQATPEIDVGSQGLETESISAQPDFAGVTDQVNSVADQVVTDQPKQVVVNKNVNRLSASVEQLANDYKARGFDKFRAWDEFIKDRDLRPEIGANDFYKIYNEATAMPLVSREIQDFVPTHRDTIRGNTAQFTDMGNYYKILWEDGRTGTTPKSLTDQFEPLPDPIQQALVRDQVKEIYSLKSRSIAGYDRANGNGSAQEAINAGLLEDVDGVLRPTQLTKDTIFGQVPIQLPVKTKKNVPTIKVFYESQDIPPYAIEVKTHQIDDRAIKHAYIPHSRWQEFVDNGYPIYKSMDDAKANTPIDMANIQAQEVPDSTLLPPDKVVAIMKEKNKIPAGESISLQGVMGRIKPQSEIRLDATKPVFNNVTDDMDKLRKASQSAKRRLEFFKKKYDVLGYIKATNYQELRSNQARKKYGSDMNVLANDLNIFRSSAKQASTEKSAIKRAGIYGVLDDNQRQSFWDVVQHKAHLANYEKHNSVPPEIDINNVKNQYDTEILSLSQTPEGKEVLNAVARYEKTIEDIKTDLILRNKLDATDISDEFYFPRIVFNYAEDPIYNPKELHKAFRGYTIRAKGGTESILIDDKVIDDYFTRVEYDNAIDDFTESWLKRADRSDTFAKLADSELVKFQDDYVPYQFKKGNVTYTDQVVNFKELDDEIETFLDNYPDFTPDDVSSFLDSIRSTDPKTTMAKMAHFIGQRNKEYWIPKPMAEAFSSMTSTSGKLLRTLESYTRAWKSMTLMQSTLKGAYQLWNYLGDWANVIFRDNIEAGKYLPGVGNIYRYVAEKLGKDIPASSRNIRRASMNIPTTLTPKEENALRVAFEQNVLGTTGITDISIQSPASMQRGIGQLNNVWVKLNYMREAGPRIAMLLHQLDSIEKTGWVDTITWRNDVIGMTPEQAAGYIARNAPVDYIDAPMGYKESVNGFWLPFITYHHKNAVGHVKYYKNTVSALFGGKIPEDVLNNLVEQGIDISELKKLNRLKAVPNAVKALATGIAPIVAIYYWNTKDKNNKYATEMMPRTFQNRDSIVLYTRNSLKDQGRDKPTHAVYFAPMMPIQLFKQFAGIDRIQHYIKAINMKVMTPKQAGEAFIDDFKSVNIGPPSVIKRMVNVMPKALTSIIANKDMVTGQQVYPDDVKDSTSEKSDYIAGYFLKTLVSAVASYAYEYREGEQITASKAITDLATKNDPMIQQFSESDVERTGGLERWLLENRSLSSTLGLYEVDLLEEEGKRLDKQATKIQRKRNNQIREISDLFVDAITARLSNDQADDESSMANLQNYISKNIENGELSPDQLTINGVVYQPQSTEAYWAELDRDISQKLQTDTYMRKFYNRLVEKAVKQKDFVSAQKLRNSYTQERNNKIIRRLQNLNPDEQVKMMEYIIDDYDSEVEF